MDLWIVFMDWIYVYGLYLWIYVYGLYLCIVYFLLIIYIGIDFLRFDLILFD
jgi:hypothetical protein